MNLAEIAEKGIEVSADVVNKNLNQNPNTFFAFLNYVIIIILIVGMFANTFYLRKDVQDLGKSVEEISQKIDIQNDKISKQNEDESRMVMALEHLIKKQR